MEQCLVCPLIHGRRLCRPLGDPEDQQDLGCSELCLDYMGRVHRPKLPGGSSPPYTRVTALWRNSSESLRFMDPPPDLATLALSIALSRQYTCGSMKASITLSPCQPLGQSGNAKPPSSTTSGGISGMCSPKLLPTGPSCSAPLQLSPQLLLLPHPPPNPPPLLHPQSPNPWTWTTPT